MQTATANRDYEKLVDAARALVFQLDIVRNNPIYKGVFEIAALNHGIVYSGNNCPTFGLQLELLRQELQKFHPVQSARPDKTILSLIR